MKPSGKSWWIHESIKQQLLPHSVIPVRQYVYYQHPISPEEEIRLRRHTARDTQKGRGVYRAFDIKPPIIPSKPRASGNGHHRENWNVEQLLMAEHEVLEEIKPIMAHNATTASFRHKTAHRKSLLCSPRYGNACFAEALV